MRFRRLSIWSRHSLRNCAISPVCPTLFSYFLHASECKSWMLLARSFISGFRSWRAFLRSQHWTGSGPAEMRENIASNSASSLRDRLWCDTQFHTCKPCLHSFLAVLQSCGYHSRLSTSARVNATPFNCFS